jgi:hypothetical protein
MAGVVRQMGYLSARMGRNDLRVLRCITAQDKIDRVSYAM